MGTTTAHNDGMARNLDIDLICTFIAVAVAELARYLRESLARLQRQLERDTCLVLT